MKKFIIIILFFLTGCMNEATSYPASEQVSKSDRHANRILISDLTRLDHEMDYDLLKEAIVSTYSDHTASVWGENIEGVITEIDTDDKVVALTFDACIGTPNSFDQELIDFLIEAEVPATLFIGGQWIKENEAEFMKLANNPLFEIANHGYHHKPLSVTGASAYNITGTESVEEAFNEVYQNQLLIKELTGEFPKYFRSGTAFYDDVAVEMIEELGLKAVNYNVLGDAGGTFNQTQIVNTFQTVNPGSIFLFHMNKPNSEIASGVIEGISQLKEAGYSFVQLQEYDEFLK
ncbi:polysaccharide deacetylase family protein [Amphibacillus indicireducens]|uniref:Polysaccharide deacetylase family protein n=1 Tax=Amphibacillus indicireducens TaxID=1076330 RepID=A0ABP7VA26_9BACI